MHRVVGSIDHDRQQSAGPIQGEQLTGALKFVPKRQGHVRPIETRHERRGVRRHGKFVGELREGFEWPVSRLGLVSIGTFTVAIVENSSRTRRK